MRIFAVSSHSLGQARFMSRRYISPSPEMLSLSATMIGMNERQLESFMPLVKNGMIRPGASLVLPPARRRGPPGQVLGNLDIGLHHLEW